MKQILIAVFVLVASPALAAEITVFKSPSCGCCEGWVDHMRAEGHSIKVKDTDAMERVKTMAGVPEKFESCHTAVVDGYVIEGHVPATDVARLLAERPKAAGLAAPGMPIGSPGMEMEDTPADRYNVLLFKRDGSAKVYTRY